MMWKAILTLSGLLLGAFAGLELGAWLFHNSFDGGGLFGFLIGLPIGAIAAAVTGFLLGGAVDRKGGITAIPFRLRHGLMAAMALTVLIALIYWMSTIRPFYWIQT